MPFPKADPQHLAELLSAVAQGDERAFQQLYECSSAHLFGLLLRMLRRRELAEDALQDCFLKIWRRSESYSAERGPPMAWLQGIARYRALDLLRMQPQRYAAAEHSEEMVLQLIDARENPEDRAIESEGLGRLNRCMDELRDEHRRCLLLAYYEGYTYPELSRDLQTPVNTIKSWVRRGLASLRACLQR